MRKLFVAAAFVPAVVLLAGCPKKTGEIEAGADEAGAVVAAVEAGPVAPAAKNANDVARFPSDAPIANEQAKILAPVAQAHTSPGGGAVVATLKPGTPVTKIASHPNGEFVLVTFADPKDANGVLMGWVGKTAFSPAQIFDAGPHDASVVDAAPKLVCAPGTVAVFLGGDTVCKKRCATDKDCAPATCVVGALGHAGGTAVQVCNN